MAVSCHTWRVQLRCCSPWAAGPLPVLVRLHGIEEDGEMSHPVRRSVVAAVLVAAVLALAGPVEAGGLSRVPVSEGFFARAVSWVTMAWEMVMPGKGVAEKMNGAAPPSGGSTTNDVCVSNCDKGSGIDPNG